VGFLAVVSRLYALLGVVQCVCRLVMPLWMLLETGISMYLVSQITYVCHSVAVGELICWIVTLFCVLLSVGSLGGGLLRTAIWRIYRSFWSVCVPSVLPVSTFREYRMVRI